MTAEAIDEGNHRKFIPVLRRGTWREAAPSWLRGKYHVDLSENPYSEGAYENLVRTLLGIREQRLPLGSPWRRSVKNVPLNATSLQLVQTRY